MIDEPPQVSDPPRNWLSNAPGPDPGGLRPVCRNLSLGAFPPSLHACYTRPGEAHDIYIWSNAILGNCTSEMIVYNAISERIEGIIDTGGAAGAVVGRLFGLPWSADKVVRLNPLNPLDPRCAFLYIRPLWAARNFDIFRPEYPRMAIGVDGIGPAASNGTYWSCGEFLIETQEQAALWQDKAVLLERPVFPSVVYDPLFFWDTY